MKLAKLLGLTVILVLSACTPVTIPVALTPTAGSTVSADTAKSTASADSEDMLAGTKWTLESFGAEGAEVAVMEGSTITLEFEEGGQAGGSGGCNFYGGTYQVQDGTLAFGQIVSTLRACLDERAMQQEVQYVEALRSAGKYEVTAEKLTIWYDSGRGMLNFSRATPTPSS